MFLAAQLITCAIASNSNYHITLIYKIIICKKKFFLLFFFVATWSKRGEKRQTCSLSVDVVTSKRLGVGATSTRRWKAKEHFVDHLLLAGISLNLPPAEERLMQTRKREKQVSTKKNGEKINYYFKEKIKVWIFLFFFMNYHCLPLLQQEMPIVMYNHAIALGYVRPRQKQIGPTIRRYIKH